MRHHPTCLRQNWYLDSPCTCPDGWPRARNVGPGWQGVLAWLLFCLVAAAVSMAVILAFRPVLARADAGEADRSADYEAQDHRAAGDGCVIWSLTEPCVPIPAGMQRDVVQVAQCESRWDTNAVGRLGELGVLQLHPLHRHGMAAQGLDYAREPDRIAWATRMWQAGSWSAWACRP